MFYKLGTRIYVNDTFYIECPNCGSCIDIWHNADYMCNKCLKYFSITLGIEVTKCEK